MKNAQIHKVFLKVLDVVDHKKLLNNHLFEFYENLIKFISLFIIDNDSNKIIILPYLDKLIDMTVIPYSNK